MATSIIKSIITPRDYVVSTNASSGWYWRKWKSGRVEAWGIHNPTSTAGTAWQNGIYYYDGTLSIPADVFSSEPIRAYGTTKNNQWWFGGISSISTTSVSYRVLKPTSTSQSVSVCIYLLQF